MNVASYFSYFIVIRSFFKVKVSEQSFSEQSSEQRVL